MEKKRRKEVRKIDWKRLFVKGVEDGLKKAVELSILAILIGMAAKMILLTVPAVTLGSVAAKIVKVKLVD